MLQLQFPRYNVYFELLRFSRSQVEMCQVGIEVDSHPAYNMSVVQVFWDAKQSAT